MKAKAATIDRIKKFAKNSEEELIRCKEDFQKLKLNSSKRPIRKEAGSEGGRIGLKKGGSDKNLDSKRFITE